MGMKALLLVSFMLSLAANVANAGEGLAVYHYPYTPSACYGMANNGRWIAGVSSALWNGRGACGKYYRVTCIGGANEAPHPCKPGSVVVKVVDYCANCAGDINLSRDAFNQIGDLNAGKIRVRYDPL